MITTSVMIKLGHIMGNKMIDMKVTNSKLKIRGMKMITDNFDINKNEAEKLLNKYKSVRTVIKKLSEK